MGLTFKEDCADIRNSGIQNVIFQLKKLKCTLHLYDPWVTKEEIKKVYDIPPISKFTKNTFDGVIIAIAHKKFKNMGIKVISSLCKKNHVIYDLKFLFPKNQTSLRL